MAYNEGTGARSSGSNAWTFAIEATQLLNGCHVVREFSQPALSLPTAD